MPEGTEIHMNFVSMLMNPEVFGADAEVFRPERFLECDERQKNYMLKTIDLSFGHGRWLCLGKSLAILELNKIFVEVRCTNPGHPTVRPTRTLKTCLQKLMRANHSFVAVAGL